MSMRKLRTMRKRGGRRRRRRRRKRKEERGARDSFRRLIQRPSLSFHLFPCTQKRSPGCRALALTEHATHTYPSLVDEEVVGSRNRAHRAAKNKSLNSSSLRSSFL